MRGIPSLITDIRKKVFTEVARMAYAGGDYSQANDLPYKIVPGDQPLQVPVCTAVVLTACVIALIYLGTLPMFVQSWV